MVGPIDVKGRYRGGIATIINKIIKFSCILKNRNIDTLFFDSFRINRSKYSNGIICKENIKNTVLLFKDLLSMCRNIKPDIVYCHSSYGIALLKDLVILSLIPNSKKIIHIHFADIEYILTRNILTRYAILFLLKHAVHGIVTLSKRTSQDLFSNGIDINKIHTIYNFHDTDYSDEEYAKKRDTVINSKKVQLMFMGSLDKRKGILDLLDCMKNLDDRYMLKVCGEAISNEIKEVVSKEIQDNNNIELCGFVDGDKKTNIFSESSIFILPSYAEGLPLVLLEAVSYGCCVITTNVGSICEIFTDRNGFIINPGDLKGLIDSVLLLSDKHVLLEKMDYSFRMSKKYNIESFMKQVSDVCIKVSMNGK